MNATIDFKAMANFPQLVEAETDLIAAALSCGLTRVVTLALGDGEDYNFYFPWLGIPNQGIEFPTRHKHDIAHRPGVTNIGVIHTSRSRPTIGVLKAKGPGSAHLIQSLYS